MREGARVVEPAQYRHVLVPLDGSDFAARALTPGVSLARAFGAVLHVVGVVTEEAEAETLHEQLGSVEARPELAPVAVSVVRALDVADAVADAIADVAAQLRPSVVCMASHGRGRVSGTLLGSVAMSVLTRYRKPTVLIGPQAMDARIPTEGPVLACVDGSEVSEVSLPMAASWALALALPLRVVTVAEPGPPPLEGHSYRRAFGPNEDADEYVEHLARAWDQEHLTVDACAIYHPLSPARGIAEYVAREPVALIAVTTHARTGVARAIIGSSTAQLVHESPIPVLVAPVPR